MNAGRRKVQTGQIRDKMAEHSSLRMDADMSGHQTAITPPKRAIARAARSRRGAAAVEFALLLPLFVTIIFGIFDYGLAMFRKMELVAAARSGAQMAILNPTDTTAITSATISSAETDISSSDVSTSTSCECQDGTTDGLSGCTGTCNDGSDTRTILTVSISEDFVLKLFPGTIAITGSASVRTD